MLDGRAPASVDRYLNTVRAVLNHAAKEYDLMGWRNPFMGLEVAPKDKAQPDRDKRRPFTGEELRATRGRILGLPTTTFSASGASWKAPDAVLPRSQGCGWRT